METEEQRQTETKRQRQPITDTQSDIHKQRNIHTKTDTQGQ